MALHTFSILPGFPELRGMRTRLRAPQAGDVDALAGVVADPAVYLADCAACLDDGDRIDWIIVARADDEAIGTCTLHALDLHARSAKIGYALHPARRGRGLATDAVLRMVRWAFDTLRVERIDADVDRDNAASQRLLQRLGFTQVDALRWTLARDQPCSSSGWM